MGERGFSLIELLIASAVLGVVMGAVLAVLGQSQGAFALRQADVDLRQEARVALDILTREVRIAGYGTDNLAEVISVAEPNRFQFAADLDDGNDLPPCGPAFEAAADGGAERVTYQLAGGVLTRDIDCWDGATWSAESLGQVVARNIVGEQGLFRYYDADGNELVAAGGLDAAARARVRALALAVRMRVTESPAPGAGPRPSEHLRHHVELHNLR